MYMCVCPSQLVPACSGITVMATDVSPDTHTQRQKPLHHCCRLTAVCLKFHLFFFFLPSDSLLSLLPLCVSLFSCLLLLSSPAECRCICSADQYVWPDVKGALPTLIISLGCSALLGGEPSITFNPPGDSATPPIPSPSTPK